MEVAISYKDAKVRYPKQVKEIIAKVRKGKSKWVNIPPRDWPWRIDYALCGKSQSFQEVIAQAAKHAAKSKEQLEKEWRERMSIPVKERWKDFASRLGGCCLTIPRYGCRIPSKPVPKEIKEKELPHIKARFERDQKELAKPKAQRDKEAQALLNQLAGQPGFVAVRVVPKAKPVDPEEAKKHAERAAKKSDGVKTQEEMARRLEQQMPD